MTRLIDVLAGRSRSSSRALMNDPADGYQAYMTTYGTPSQERILPLFEQYAIQGFGGNSVVFSVMVKRLKLFSQAVLKYRDLTSKKLFGDPSLLKLEKPWPNGSTGELLARMIQDVDLAGNAYVRDAGDRLERLRPDWVTIVSQVTQDALGREVREVIGYLFEPYGDPERDCEFYLVEEVAHWSPLPDPLANFRGISWMTPILRELNADVAMTEYREMFFRNAATPNLVIRYSKAIDDKKVKSLKDRIIARYAGVNNAYKTMILDEGADLTVVGADMEKAGFSELQAANESRIASASGVPAVVAGFKDGMAAANIGDYQAGMRSFADFMVYDWRTACVALAKLVKVPAGSELWFDTTDISALRQGEKDAADTLHVMASTMNQWIIAGWTPDSVKAAAVAGDASLLVHSGLVSVQMQRLEAKSTAEVPNPNGGPVVPITNKGITALVSPGDPSKRSYTLDDDELTLLRASLQPGNAEQLHEYWTKGKGLAKWADSPQPWTTLHEHLMKFIHDPEEAKKTAAEWFHDVFHFWPGADLNRVTHGKPPRGDKVGPG